jgi:hypothetical protein
MEPTPELIDDIYRRRILQARSTPPDEKLLDGPRLFDRACRIMADGIRNQTPEADEREIQEILAARIDRLRRIEEHGLYEPLPEQSR